MPIPSNIVRLNVNASIAGGEQMVHTFHAIQQGALASATEVPDIQLMANNMAARWLEMMSTVFANASFAQLLGPQTTYQSVNTYALDTNGRATRQATAPIPQPDNRGFGDGCLPNEVALALTLNTARAGRTGRGRVFLGGLSRPSINIEGRYTPGATSVIAQAFSGMFSALSREGDSEVYCGVLSRQSSTFNKIVSVGAGDVPDVQRRRRNGLREVYDVRAVTMA
jgi:hypothetical protein